MVDALCLPAWTVIPDPRCVSRSTRLEVSGSGSSPAVRLRASHFGFPSVPCLGREREERAGLAGLRAETPCTLWSAGSVSAGTYSGSSSSSKGQPTPTTGRRCRETLGASRGLRHSNTRGPFASCLPQARRLLVSQNFRFWPKVGHRGPYPKSFKSALAVPLTKLTAVF